MHPRETFEAIVLAAGQGSRFGGGKLTSRYRGRPLIEGALRAASAAPVTRIVVVSGAYREAVEAVVAGFASPVTVEIVHAADHGQGLSASLRCGVASLTAGITGAFVFLGDMPDIPAAVLQPLADAVARGAAAALPTWNGAPGHPVVLSPPLLEKVSGLDGDRGARILLDDCPPAHVVLLPVADRDVVFDVDRKVDLIGGGN